jgi:flavoprotein
MARGISSTLITAAISGAIGFGVGVYVTPPDKADEFRALVNSKLEEIKRPHASGVVRDRA